VTARDAPLLPTLAVCTLAAGLLRFSTLHTQSYWYDEAVTVDILRRSFGGMLSGVAHSESTPPLYYVVAWAWSKLFGTSETGLRSLSAAVGTATVPVAFAAARTFVGRRSSLVASALVAVSPFLVWYSQEARAYALLVLLAAGSLATLRRRPAVWALVANLALAAHYFAGFLIAAEAGWLLRHAADRRAAQRAVGAVAMTAAALVPLAVYQARYSEHTAWISRSGSIVGRAEYLLHQLVIGAYPSSHLRPLIVIVALAVAVGVFAWTEKSDRYGAAVALSFGLIAIALPLALAVLGDHFAGGRGDYFIYRNVIVAAIPLTIAAGAVLQRAGVAVVVIVCGLLAAVSIDIARRPDLQRPDIRGVAAAVGSQGVGRLVVADSRTATVLKLYLAVDEPSPDSSVNVSCIDVVLDPHGRVPSDAPSGFRRVGMEHVHAFTIVHFQSRDPQAVRPGGVERTLRLGYDVEILSSRARAGESHRSRQGGCSARA
jgi:mannosyltransferase